MGHSKRALWTWAMQEHPFWLWVRRKHRALTSHRPRWRHWGSWWIPACYWDSLSAGSLCSPRSGIGTCHAGMPGMVWKPSREKGKTYFPSKLAFALAVRNLKLIDERRAQGIAKNVPIHWLPDIHVHLNSTSCSMKPAFLLIFLFQP